MARKILVVEDRSNLLQLERIILTSKGYVVLEAGDGKTALQMVAANTPDLILLDIMLPEIDGFEVCRRVKENTRSCHIPVIILTARRTVEDKVRAREAGADVFLTKPFRSSEVLTAIDRLLPAELD